MKEFLKVSMLTGALCIGALAGQADANVIFTFAQVGGTVTMTSSGTLDTSKLLVSVLSDGWGGVGTENNATAGDIDIMGGTSFGPVDAQFGFHPGTNASAITNPGGPFAFSSFPPITVSGSESFTTYSGFIGAFRQPGIGIVRADMVGALWTPNQNWTYNGLNTFASLGLNPGTYAVSDIETHETITIQIGANAVPEPASMTLLGSGLGMLGLAAFKRRRKI